MRTELLWLGLLAPLYLFPTAAGSPALLALPGLWIARRVARGRFVPRTPADGAILGLLVMVDLSLFATPDLRFSLGKIAGLLFGIALYYALVEWATPPGRLRWALAGYAAAGTLLAVVGLLGVNWIDKFPVLTRLGAHIPTLLHGLPGAQYGIEPNEIAGALLWVVPLQVGLLRGIWPGHPAARGAWAAWAALIGLAAICAAALVLTQSRSALAGCLVSAAVAVWLLLPRGRWLLGALLLAVVAGTVVVGPATILARVSGTTGQAFGTSADLLTVKGRTEIWARAIYAIGDFPLTGMGMNSFRRLLFVWYTPFSVQPDVPIGQAPGNLTDMPAVDEAHAHNQFLQAALDLGLPGLVAYLALWIVAGAEVVGAWRAAADATARAVAAGSGAALLAYGVYGMADTVALGAKPGIFFWALLALLAVVYSSSRSARRSASASQSCACSGGGAHSADQPSHWTAR